MRISDWSSDVCSSDLIICSSSADTMALGVRASFIIFFCFRSSRLEQGTKCAGRASTITRHAWRGESGGAIQRFDSQLVIGVNARSEDHTSELQSLMRTKYHFFSLNKKIDNKQHI